MDIGIERDVYVPHDAQIRFHQSGARFVCAAAGVRGGKSKAASIEFLARVMRDATNPKKGRRVAGQGRGRRPRLHYWVIAPTFPLLKEPIRYIHEAVQPQWWDSWHETDSALWLKGDILIEFKGADKPQNLVSVGLNGVWLDEAARIKADAWRGQLRQRLTDQRGWGVFSTTPLGRNWVYEDLVQLDGTNGYRVVSWRTVDNPHISPLEIEHARRTLPAAYYKREYEASFDAFIGQVYDEFDDRAHVVTPDQLRAEYGTNYKKVFKRVIAGVDWGWNSPGAIVVIGDLGRRWVVLDESYSPNRIIFDPSLSAGTWVSEAFRLKEKWGIKQFYCDPARPDAIYDFQRAGLPVMGGQNDIAFGIRKVSESLHPTDIGPRLRISSECKETIRELRDYRWAEQRDSTNLLDVPADNQSDHAIDALRYAMVELMRYEETSSGARILPLAYGARGPVG